MGEAHPIALECHDALGLHLLDPLDQLRRGDSVGAGQQLHGGFGHAGHAEQQGAGVVVELADPPAHQVGKGGGQRLLGAGGAVADGSCQLEREKRVPAGDLGDPQHGRTGECPP